ncbi:Flp-18 GPCR receptor [Aphelenchoides besseyi]|nr:Flp-18 GPCR receptor [Aphelenchoides besseyi]KAI6226969.1 Flp-18 GPCR receptor [Aphelenchoides besseyi]
MLSNGSTECTVLNDYLWSLTRDPTTLPAVWILFAFFYSLIIIIGVTGNLCVVLAISRTRSLQTVPNLFIFSLSCSDIMVCFTSAIITPITAFKKVWIFGSLLCSLLPFLAGSSLSFSTFILAAISIDRYVLIRFPMKKPFTTSQAFMVISIISILSMGISGPSALFHTLRTIQPYCGNYCFEDWGQYQGQKRAYGTILLAVQFILPLSIIVFCYANISFRLGHSLLLKGKKRDYGWQLAMSDQQRVASKRRQRTNRMFIAMVVAFSLSWIWNLLFNVLSDYRALPKIIQNNHYLFGITSHALAMTSTIWNPILYSLLNLQLRAAFIDLMPRTIRKCLMKDDEQYVGPRAHHRNVPSSMLLTAESRAFDRSGASTPIPPTRNGWLTPALNGPRNSFAFSSPIEDTNGKMESQLIGESATQPTKSRLRKWIRSLIRHPTQRQSHQQNDCAREQSYDLPLQSMSKKLSLRQSNGLTAVLQNVDTVKRTDQNANHPILIVPSIQIDEVPNDPTMEDEEA